MQNRVILEEERIYHLNEDESCYLNSLENVQKRLKIRIGRKSPSMLEFDLIGVPTSFANAIRRIIISEVPTVAIEKVFIFNNTGVIPDEVLSHRLGLIPWRVDPRKLEFKTAEEEATELNTLVFKLKIGCKHNPKKPESKQQELHPTEKYIDSVVYSSHLQWIPQGQQELTLGKVEPVYKDIVITKLRPGQELDIELHAEKGTGEDHAKWSPVATASYRLLPEIIIKEDEESGGGVFDEDAVKLKACFAPGVIELESTKDGRKKAVVVNPRKDTVSREALRHAEFKDKIVLTRVKDHFIFSVESTGCYPEPEDIVRESLKILINKCKKIKENLIPSSTILE